MTTGTIKRDPIQDTEFVIPATYGEPEVQYVFGDKNVPTSLARAPSP